MHDENVPNSYRGFLGFLKSDVRRNRTRSRVKGMEASLSDAKSVRLKSVGGTLVICALRGNLIGVRGNPHMNNKRISTARGRSHRDLYLAGRTTNRYSKVRLSLHINPAMRYRKIG